MASSSLTNDDDKIHEKCNENLAKAEALINVALNADFSEITASTIHDFHWTISDLIKNAKEVNEALCPSKIITIRRFLLRLAKYKKTDR